MTCLFAFLVMTGLFCLRGQDACSGREFSVVKEDPAFVGQEFAVMRMGSAYSGREFAVVRMGSAFAGREFAVVKEAPAFVGQEFAVVRAIDAAGFFRTVKNEPAQTAVLLGFYQNRKNLASTTRSAGKALSGPQKTSHYKSKLLSKRFYATAGEEPKLNRHKPDTARNTQGTGNKP